MEDWQTYTNGAYGFSVKYPGSIYVARAGEKGLLLWRKSKDIKRDLYEVSVISLAKAEEAFTKDVSGYIQVLRQSHGKTIQLVLLNKDVKKIFDEIVKTFKVLK